MTQSHDEGRWNFNRGGCKAELWDVVSRRSTSAKWLSLLAALVVGGKLA